MALNSGPRKPDSYRRSRVLKRGGSHEPIQDADLKYLWAGYKRGSFGAEMPEGLTAIAFKARIMELLSGLLTSGGEAMIFRNKDGLPVGLILMNITGSMLEPHAFWFPEATPRIRLESILRWLIEYKAKYRLFLWIKSKDWKFYDHLCKYGVLRTVGKYRKFFDDGEDAFLFQGVA